MSKKYQERQRKKKAAYEEFDKNNDGICSGCERMLPGSHSHLIPVSEAPELEAEPKNIRWHCIERCHSIWESHNILEMQKLKDFDRNMEYIKQVRPLYYNRLIS